MVSASLGNFFSWKSFSHVIAAIKRRVQTMLSLLSDWLNKPHDLLLVQVALWTLGQLVASTGYVVEPYRKYPTLLEVLLNFLKTEQNQGTRREVGNMANLCSLKTLLKIWKEIVALIRSDGVLIRCLLCSSS